MFLIRKYAVDKDSAAVLLEWFKPYESFAYDRVGDIHTLRNKIRFLNKYWQKTITL